MSYGGSPSRGFDDVDDYGREDRPREHQKIKCRQCKYFCYQIHHASYCSHEPPIRKGVKELHDGRITRCEHGIIRVA